MPNKYDHELDKTINFLKKDFSKNPVISFQSLKKIAYNSKHSQNNRLKACQAIIDCAKSVDNRVLTKTKNQQSFGSWWNPFTDHGVKISTTITTVTHIKQKELTRAKNQKSLLNIAINHHKSVKKDWDQLISAKDFSKSALIPLKIKAFKGEYSDLEHAVTLAYIYKKIYQSSNNSPLPDSENAWYRRDNLFAKLASYASDNKNHYNDLIQSLYSEIALIHACHLSQQESNNNNNNNNVIVLESSYCENFSENEDELRDNMDNSDDIDIENFSNKDEYIFENSQTLFNYNNNNNESNVVTDSLIIIENSDDSDSEYEKVLDESIELW